MNRIEWLTEKYSEPLRKKHKTTSVILHVNDFVDVDPSANKRFVQWLIKTYLNDGYRHEDLSKVKETLTFFMAYQNKLSPRERDINNFSTLSDLWIAIKPFAEQALDKKSASGKEQKRREKAIARDQSILLVDEEDFKVAIPLTEYASKWWGRGTRWCTAAENDNYFDIYHSKGPLFVFILPDGAKYQFFATDSDLQFMDSDDSPISKAVIEEFWPLFSPVIFWAVSKNGLLLDYIPNKFRTPELCIEAIKDGRGSLDSVPEEMLSHEICMEALETNGEALEWLNIDDLSDEYLLEAVKRNGLALQSVPSARKTPELCLEAVRNSGTALRYVPKSKRTYEICMEAVETYVNALKFIPKPLLNDEICFKAVSQSWRALEFVPDVLHNEKLYTVALKQSGRAISLIPVANRTEKMYREAVAKSGSSLVWVPENYHNDELYLLAVKSQGTVLQYIPNQFRTAEICLEAVKNDGEALYSVPDRLKTQEMCRIAVRQNGSFLQYVPTKKRSIELCIDAAQNNKRWALPHVPSEILEQVKNAAALPATSPDWLDNIKFIEELRSLWPTSGNYNCPTPL